MFPLILILSLILSCTANRTVQDSRIDKSVDYLIEGNFKLIEADNLGNVYLVDKNNGITVYDKQLKKLFQYSIRSLGNISKIDVRNPQKLLVYYGDYLKIVFLDNTLSKIKELDFESLGFWDVQAIALSRDNFIWMYDPVNGRLQKINDNGEVLLSTNESFDNTVDLNASQQIAVIEDKVLVTQEGQILIFDEFGNFNRSISQETTGIKVIDDKLYSINERTISEVDLSIKLNNQQGTLAVLPSDVRDYLFLDSKIYYLDNSGLYLMGL